MTNTREYSREQARRRAYRMRVLEWEKALNYLLTLEGGVEELAEEMAKVYRLGRPPRLDK